MSNKRSRKETSSVVRQVVHRVIDELPDSKMVHSLALMRIVKNLPDKYSKGIEKELWLKQGLSIREPKKDRKFLTELPSNYQKRFMDWLEKAGSENQLGFPPIVVLPMMTALILCSQPSKDPVADLAREASVDVVLREIIFMLDAFNIKSDVSKER